MGFLTQEAEDAKLASGDTPPITRLEKAYYEQMTKISQLERQLAAAVECITHASVLLHEKSEQNRRLAQTALIDTLTRIKEMT